MKSNFRSCLLLHTALNVRKYKAKRISPVFDDRTRRVHYLRGFEALYVHFPQVLDLDVMIVDNTDAKVSELMELSEPIRSPFTRYLSFNKNRFGRWNKGAGNLETLSSVLPELEKQFDNIFYFEPRLQLRDGEPFVRFFSDPKTTIYLSPTLGAALTGYCGFAIADLREFVQSVSPFWLTISRTSLENHLYKVAITCDRFEVRQENGYCDRFDPIRGQIPY